MPWTIFAAISIVSMSVANLFQKIAMKEKKSDAITSALIFQFLCVAFTGAFALVKGFRVPALAILFPYTLVSSLCWAFGTVCFFMAIKRIEASEMILLTGFGAIVTIVVSSIFLQYFCTNEI